jgi:hypothetical protein
MSGDRPVTRHSHGGIWHEHESGHVRHDHEGLSVGGGSPYRGEAMLGIGIAVAVAGGIADIGLGALGAEALGGPACPAWPVRSLRSFR